MGFEKSGTRGVPSDKKIDRKYDDLLDQAIDSADADGEDVKEISHDSPGGKSSTPNGVMHSGLMTWTTMLEEMDEIQASADKGSDDDTAIDDQPIDANSEIDDKEILDELNKLFTPVLVSQNFENEISQKVNNEISEAGVLTERNIISFDDETRMAQLINVCAKLIAKKKNTNSWQMFQKAAAIKKQASINIQKEEYDLAKTLAQKYLIMVSTTNNSSVARDAANDLLPQTQH